jgi:hypothetical protein
MGARHDHLTSHEQLTRRWDGEPHHGKGERNLKQRIIHESREFLKVFLFVAPFFCAFATYRMLLLDQFEEKYFAYGTAFVNALVLSKIILLGEYLRLGKRLEHKPLIYSTIYKSFLFTLLVAVFHVLEDAVKGLLHGETISSVFAALGGQGITEVLGRGLVMFWAFLPFFAMRETARILGEARLTDLFFRTRVSAEMRPNRETNPHG